MLEMFFVNNFQNQKKNVTKHFVVVFFVVFCFRKDLNINSELKKYYIKFFEKILDCFFNKNRCTKIL